MAVPIKKIPDTPESIDEIRSRIERARVDHAKAVLAGYELLQVAQDKGILDILRGSLGASDAIITKLALASNSAEGINIVRNLVSMGRLLASVDPDLLHSLADQLSAKRPKETPAPPPKLWTAIKIFASRDSRRALAGTAAFVQAFGRALAVSKQKKR